MSTSGPAVGRALNPPKAYQDGPFYRFHRRT
jgi:hypothetical protein